MQARAGLPGVRSAHQGRCELCLSRLGRRYSAAAAELSAARDPEGGRALRAVASARPQGGQKVTTHAAFTLGSLHRA